MTKTKDTEPKKKKVVPVLPSPATPAQRWMLSKYPPVVPKFLDVILAPVKREDRTGVLWKRDIMKNAWFPDLEDPATRGVLLDVVRTAWGMPTGMTVAYSDDEALWKMSWSGATHGGWCGTGTTEGAAMVSALEGVP
jgi:hypothetical protein